MLYVHSGGPGEEGKSLSPPVCMSGASLASCDLFFYIQTLDNCRIHHAHRDELVNICARKGVVVKFLAPYNPQSMPIENFFSSVKSLAAGPRS